jgi:hypothetical protein
MRVIVIKKQYISFVFAVFPQIERYSDFTAQMICSGSPNIV